MKKVLIFGAVMLVVLISAFTVSAGSISFSGTFTSADPTMPVVFISTPNCTGQGVTLVRYHAYPFTVTATGLYSFTVAATGSPNSVASIYIMDSGFNPAAAFANCLYGSNSGSPTTLSNVNLTASTAYYLVIFDDTFSQDVPGYDFSANGVGDILIGTTGSASCSDPLPTDAVLRNVPLGAPAYYAADAGTLLSFSLPAGNWYVTQTSGDFAEIWIACEADRIWIPLTALG